MVWPLVSCLALVNRSSLRLLQATLIKLGEEKRHEGRNEREIEEGSDGEYDKNIF